MVDKVIPWSVGDGNISLSYSGDKNGVITITSDENTLWEDRSMNIIISTTKGSPEKSQTVVLTQKGKTLVAGTTFNFDYTGTVQSVELPKGKYKLQCWGAQGGNSAGHSYGTGSKGGYSEGVLTLTEKTTLYVFVGGQGSRGSSTSLVNGGWNGGGASVGYASYGSNSDHYGESYPASGGGATDIALVTSSMSYANGRTNRSSESLLSRIIVAGGGAGGSYRYTEETVTSTRDVLYESYSGTCSNDRGSSNANIRYYYQIAYKSSDYDIVGRTFKVTKSSSSKTVLIMEYYTDNGTSNGAYGGTLIYTSPTSGSSSTTITIPNCWRITVAMCSSTSGVSASFYLYEQETVTSSSTSSSYSNQSQQGGGTSGKGQYPGTQSAGGNGNGNDGGFGFGGSQTQSNYRYVSGGAGGGWYGGGTAYSDSSASYINYSGGGSGFVNIAANSSYRPTGYTGLQLDSGTTIAGDTSHPSVSGGTETGHSSNGYARIIALDEDGNYPIPEPTVTINWDVQSGTWHSYSNSSAADGVSNTCVSPGSSGSTIIRCTFSGVTAITFNCIYQGENNYDYLTVGKLDTACTRSSYGTTLRGTSGTAKDITFTCDSGTHYVEFCYSKDGSVDTSPDNATVYVKSYS